MAYDNTSFYGDMVVDEYDDANNFMNPPSSTGFYVYHILGDSFDLMSEQCSQWMNDFSLVTASVGSLDKYWGVSYDMPRPALPTSERLLTDEEYRAYLYLRNCQLLTREDLLVNMGKIFGLDDYELYFSEETSYLSATDHHIYTASVTDSSNIAKNNDDTSDDYIVPLGSDDTDVHLLEGNLSTSGEVVQVINIPYQGWDAEFLEYLEQFISVKGNLKIREYQL